MRNKIIYWISTVWLALGMLSSAIVQLLNVKEEVEMISHLGYPIYFTKILAVWKILGVIALFIPKFPRLKEWAYAGILVNLIAAAHHHYIAGDDVAKITIPLVVLSIAAASSALRPPSRRLQGSLM